MSFFKTMMKSKKTSINKNCYHEDGGPRAVFVAIDAASTVVVSRERFCIVIIIYLFIFLNLFSFRWIESSRFEGTTL